MARLRGGTAGRERMKEVTSSVLRRVQIAAPTLTASQLESLLPMGLRSLKLDIARGVVVDQSAGDVSTGQEFKRYMSKETSFSFAKLAQVVEAARTSLGLTLSDDDLFRLGLHELPPGTDPTFRLERFERAKRVFSVGIDRMHHGLMPLAPSQKGGRPRPARDAAEANAAFQRWTLEIASLGGRVREDRQSGPPDFLEPENEEEQEGWDYNLLDEGLRPFSPFNPHPAAIDRLRLKLSRNWGANKPAYPTPLRDACGTPPEEVFPSRTEATHREGLEAELHRILFCGPSSEGGKRAERKAGPKKSEERQRHVKSRRSSNDEQS